MDVTGWHSIFSHSTRRLIHRVAEVVHTAAVYLGIAAFVTIVLGLTVPSLRDQSYQIHAALLTSLRPAAPVESNYLGVVNKDDQAKSFIETLGELDTFSIPGVSKAQSQALRSYIARKYRIAHNVAGSLIETVFDVGKEKNLDPQLLLAVIAIESRYNPFAESHAGAQGLMQVMTKVHKEKFDDFEGGVDAAINPIANIQVGSQILYDCIKRRGSIRAGLACYVGATGPGDGGYGAKVLAERRRIALASGIPLADP